MTSGVDPGGYIGPSPARSSSLQPAARPLGPWHPRTKDQAKGTPQSWILRFFVFFVLPCDLRCPCRSGARSNPAISATRRQGIPRRCYTVLLVIRWSRVLLSSEVPGWVVCQSGAPPLSRQAPGPGPMPMPHAPPDRTTGPQALAGPKQPLACGAREPLALKGRLADGWRGFPRT